MNPLRFANVRFLAKFVTALCCAASVGCGSNGEVPGPADSPLRSTVAETAFVRAVSSSMSKASTYRFTVDGPLSAGSAAGVARTDGKQWWTYRFPGRLPDVERWGDEWTVLARRRSAGLLNSHYREQGCREPYTRFIGDTRNVSCPLLLQFNVVVFAGIDDPASVRAQAREFLAARKRRSEQSGVYRLVRREATNDKVFFVYQLDMPLRGAKPPTTERTTWWVDESWRPFRRDDALVRSGELDAETMVRTTFSHYDEPIVQPENPAEGAR